MRKFSIINLTTKKITTLCNKQESAIRQAKSLEQLQKNGVEAILVVFDNENSVMVGAYKNRESIDSKEYSSPESISTCAGLVETHYQTTEL